MYYSVFGITLRSDFTLEVLDELLARPETVDLEIKRVTGITRPSHIYDPFFDISPDVQYFHWIAIGTFVIDETGTVLIEPHEGITDLLISHALLGLVMSVVLERRSLLCLHASAVSIGGKAAIFLGDKGAGKSTTNSALLAHGCAPISDDLVPVAVTSDLSDLPIVYPGFSSTKLYPDSIDALGLEAEATDRPIHFTTKKIQKQMTSAVLSHHVPIEALFVLRRSADVETCAFEPLPPHTALQAILRYSFKARYGETKLGPDSLITHMKNSGSLVAKAPVFDLLIPEDLEQLKGLAEAIIEKVESLAQRSQD